MLNDIETAIRHFFMILFLAVCTGLFFGGITRLIDWLVSLF